MDAPAHISSAARRALHEGSSERGFTLIELILAAAIFTIAIGLTASVLVKAFDGSGRSAAQQTVESQASHALDDIGADVQSARAQDRTDLQVPNKDDLQRALLNAHAVYSRTSGAALDLLDVWKATSTEVVLEVPGHTAGAAAGALHDDCVDYKLVTSGGPGATWNVDRIVKRAGSGTTACTNGGPGPIIEQETIFAGTASLPGGVPPSSLFSYTMLPCANGPVCAGGGCGQTPGPPPDR